MNELQQLMRLRDQMLLIEANPANDRATVQLAAAIHAVATILQTMLEQTRAR